MIDHRELHIKMSGIKELQSAVFIGNREKKGWS